MKKYFIATIVSIIYIPLITIVAELYAPLKDFLKNIFWHHWLGKSAILVILFIAVTLISGAFLSKHEEDNNRDSRFLTSVFWLSVFSALAVLLFFVIEYTKHI